MTDYAEHGTPTAGNGTRKKEPPRWHAPFLKALASSGNVLVACQTTDVARTTAYRHRNRFSTFARKWDDAIDEAVDSLEAEARRRALDGVEKPIYYKGKKIDVIREYSDTLLIFLLKAHRPEKFRDNYDVRRLFEEISAAQQPIASGV